VITPNGPAFQPGHYEDVKHIPGTGMSVEGKTFVKDAPAPVHSGVNVQPNFDYLYPRGQAVGKPGPFRPLATVPFNANAVDTMNSQTSAGPLPAVISHATNTLKTHFENASPEDVTPSPARQLQSDVQFDMFNLVPPGFGLGQRNKLFVENEQRESFLKYQHNYPFRPDSGVPTNITPPPWQWQDVMAPGMVKAFLEKLSKQVDDIKKAVSSVRAGTVGALPSDVVTLPSSKGLPRRPSPFVPVHNNTDAFVSTVQPAGFFMNRRPFRHITSTWRDPEQAEFDAQNSGPVFRRRRQLAFNLP
jgi:hypothetical protein